MATALWAAPAEEFRGIWVTRFEWPRTDQAECKANIDEIMKTVAAHRFNAVIFQMRGQCDTFYPSPEEPWSPLISPNGSDPGWDPMQYAIEAAHANNLQFHAYINTHVAWQTTGSDKPAVASHVYFKHFDPSDPKTCDWLVHDGEGKPLLRGGDSYVWIAPGVPAAQAYTRRQIMYVVNKYNVDGIHFDRIRTPTPDCSHDPISMERQATGSEGNPGNLDFAAWTADQFTRFLCDLYAQVTEVKPHMVVSSAPLGLVSVDRYPGYSAGFHYGVTKCHQDAQAWLAAGAMDFIAPQIYWGDDDKKKPDFSDILPDWVEHAAGRYICPGQTVGVGVKQLIHQVQVTREQGGKGNIVFSYRGLLSKNGIAQYSKAGGIYEASAAVPPMPWKDNPPEGIILGTITDAHTGEPVTDAQIRRNDSDYAALSSADGVYSFLKVPPGKYTLTIRKKDVPDQQVADLVVEAGKVTRADVKLGEAPAVVAAVETPATAPAVAATAPATAEPVVVAAEEPKPAEQVERPASRIPIGGVPKVTVTVAREESGTFKWIMVVVMLVGFAVLAVGLVWHLKSRSR